MRKMGSLTICANRFSVCAEFGKTCALHAPTVFSARMKSASARKTKFQWRQMREARYAGTKTRLWTRAKSVSGFLSKIADCARTDSRPRAIGDPRGRGAVRASSSAAARDFRQGSPKSAKGHCALSRANRVFGTDKRRIRTKNTVMVNSKRSAESPTRSLIGRGCAFHPCPISDPRGRFSSAQVFATG